MRDIVRPLFSAHLMEMAAGPGVGGGCLVYVCVWLVTRGQLLVPPDCVSISLTPPLCW